MADETQSGAVLIDLTAQIIASYVGHNKVQAGDLPALITTVVTALRSASTPQPTPEPEKLSPAVPIKKSVTPDYLICLEDGKKFKSLKRHLRTHYDMSPEEYRTKWGLPADYPMVAPAYANARSELAKRMGLGQQRRKSATPPPPPAPDPKRRSSKKAAA
jgi:predicted transcriptional regulator